MAGAPYEAGGIRGHDRGDPRGVGDDELRALAARAARRGARAPGSPTSRSSPATGSTVESERAALPSWRAELTDDVTFLGAHAGAARVRGPRRRLRRARLRRDARRLRAARAAGSTSSASAAPSTPSSRARCSRPAATPASACGSTATSSARARACALAVEMGAASVDHCTYLDDADVEALGRSETVATFLPATDFSTRQPYPTPAGRSTPGSTVAIATNTNPGSSYTTSMPFCIALAVRDMGMTIDEALRRRRSAARRALRRDDIGRLAPGARADAVDPRRALATPHLVYRPGRAADRRGVPLGRLLNVSRSRVPPRRRGPVRA